MGVTSVSSADREKEKKNEHDLFFHKSPLESHNPTRPPGKSRAAGCSCVFSVRDCEEY
jgi:hypothetical protein